MDRSLAGPQAVACRKQRGFGLVELVVTVAILGVLMLVAIPVFGAIQKTARENVSKDNLKQVVQAIDIARAKENKTLLEITKSGCTRCSFASSDDPLLMPQTHNGWVTYKRSMERIGTAAGMNIGVPLDGNGRPFFLDENEGETAGACVRDGLGTWAHPFTGAVTNRADPYTLKC